MEYVDVEIKGVTPLLHHRFAETAEVDAETRRVKKKYPTPREQAELAAYRLPDGTLYLPGISIARMCVEAGAKHKQRASRKSLKYIVSAALLVMDDAIPILDPNTGEKIKDFEVDSRPVVIPATKGRILRHRPRYEEWMARFRIRINDTVLDEETIHMLLREGGEQIGIGDYRPQTFGPFGVFRVTRFDRISEAFAAE